MDKLKKMLIIMICVFSFFLVVAAGIYFYVKNKSSDDTESSSAEVGVITEIEEAEDFYGWDIEGYIEYPNDTQDMSFLGEMISSVYKGKLNDDNRLYFWGNYGEGWLNLSFSPDGVYEDSSDSVVTLHSDENGTYLGLEGLYPYFGDGEVQNERYVNYLYDFSGKYIRVADGSTDILTDLETMITESLKKEGAAYGNTDNGLAAATFPEISCSSGTPFSEVLGKIAGDAAMTFDTDGEYGNRVAELNAETDDIIFRVQLIENPEFKKADILDESKVVTREEVEEMIKNGN